MDAGRARAVNRNETAFWLGTAGVVFGVIAHLPMFAHSAAMNYRMVGMEMGPLMLFGMGTIILGLGAVAYGLAAPVMRAGAARASLARAIEVRALDDAPMSAAHWKLFIVLVIALIVDVMKPATLGFVMPGTIEEYGLSKSTAALVPVAGIFGTAVGSFVWGWAGDAIGRRASILMAAMMFIATSICGAMPSFSWNVVMCFMMGLGAGGLLPIAFALFAEIVPTRHRGFFLVLLGGLGTLGGYLAASGAAALLEPHFGWRILWLIGLPTGAALILLNRFIPESPRFLIAQGRRQEAETVLAKFGVATAVSSIGEAKGEQPIGELDKTARAGGADMRLLFGDRLRFLSLSVGFYGLAWGLVNFGFLLWLPVNLQQIGAESVSSLLAQSALIAFPSTLVIAWLYQNWSAKGAMILAAMLTSISLLGLAGLGDGIASSPIVTTVLIAMLLVASNAVIAVLSPYAAEVYPVSIRATGSGWAAGASKAAGVLTLSAAALGAAPGITTGAVIAAAPMLVASLLIHRYGKETRGVGLDDTRANS